MSRTLAGQSYRPSNGTEGDEFEGRWCAGCRYYSVPSGEDYPECSRGLILKAETHLVGDPGYPTQWRYDDFGRPYCTAFRERGRKKKYERSEEWDRHFKRMHGE